MYRPEHDAKPLSNNPNAIPWQASFLFMRRYWQYRRRWSDEYQPGATPGRSTSPAVGKSVVT